MTNDTQKKRIKAKNRAKLLAQLEHIIGGNCYNGNIQNWGPNGVFEGEGREFCSPLCLRIQRAAVAPR